MHCPTVLHCVDDYCPTVLHCVDDYCRVVTVLHCVDDYCPTVLHCVDDYCRVVTVLHCVDDYLTSFVVVAECLSHGTMNIIYIICAVNKKTCRVHLTTLVCWITHKFIVSMVLAEVVYLKLPVGDVM